MSLAKMLRLEVMSLATTTSGVVYENPTGRVVAFQILGSTGLDCALQINIGRS